MFCSQLYYIPQPPLSRHTNKMASSSSAASPCLARGPATLPTRTLPPRSLQRLARSLRCAAAPPDGTQPSLSSPGDSTLSTDLTAFPGTARATQLPTRTKVEPTPGHADFDWDGWSAFFDELDEAATRVDELQAMIQRAADEEDYAAAAELKQELDAVLAKDSVAAVLRALDEALAQEDYSAAATLRDEGGAGLLGWWQGRAGPDDPQGHVLRIEAEFGRYVGTMYKAADLADVKARTVGCNDTMTMTCAAHMSTYMYTQLARDALVPHNTCPPMTITGLVRGVVLLALVHPALAPRRGRSHV